MNCESINQLFTAFLDGELSDREINVVKEHLADCPRCEEDLKAIVDKYEDSLNLSYVRFPENLGNWS